MFSEILEQGRILMSNGRLYLYSYWLLKKKSGRTSVDNDKE